MQLEKQVTSLEISKRLKELGVKQESLFWWAEYKNPLYPNHRAHLQDTQAVVLPENEYYSAFTVAELGEMLPYVLKKDEKLYYLQCNANGNSLKYMDYTTYDSNGTGTFLRAYPLVGAKSEADARGKLLIYLLENGLVTL